MNRFEKLWENNQFRVMLGVLFLGFIVLLVTRGCST